MSKADFQPVIQETIELPSKGLLNYDIPNEFNIRPLTVNEMKMLYGSSNTINALDNIIKSVVNVPDFPVEKLHIGDKLYLAYRIRSVTFGEEYKVNVYCPTCNKRVDVSLNLMDADIDYLPEGFTDPREIGELPVSKDKISLKVMRGFDYEKVFKRAQEIKRNFPDFLGDPMYHLSLAAQIHSINGKVCKNPRETEEYILKLHARDDFYITKKVKEINCGPKPIQTVTCPDCGEPLSIAIEVGEDFFRPELGD